MGFFQVRRVIIQLLEFLYFCKTPKIIGFNKSEKIIIINYNGKKNYWVN